MIFGLTGTKDEKHMGNEEAVICIGVGIVVACTAAHLTHNWWIFGIPMGFLALGGIVFVTAVHFIYR